MTKKRKLIKSSIILMILLLLIGSVSTASLTPLAAHKRSERTANYGPSTIIKSVKVKGGMLYLCKYDKWYSLNTVKRGFLGMWYAGDQVHGRENDIKNPIDFSWGTSSTNFNRLVGKFFGVVNDSSIKSVSLEVEHNGETKVWVQKELYDNMFAFTWDGNSSDYKFNKLTGLDKDSNVVYEKILP